VSGYNDRYTWMRESGEGTQLSKAQIRESIDSSLARLETDYIDVLQFHWPERVVSLTVSNTKQVPFCSNQSLLSSSHALIAYGEDTSASESFVFWSALCVGGSPPYVFNTRNQNKTTPFYSYLACFLNPLTATTHVSPHSPHVCFVCCVCVDR